MLDWRRILACAALQVLLLQACTWLAGISLAWWHSYADSLSEAWGLARRLGRRLGWVLLFLAYLAFLRRTPHWRAAHALAVLLLVQPLNLLLDYLLFGPNGAQLYGSVLLRHLQACALGWGCARLLFPPAAGPAGRQR